MNWSNTPPAEPGVYWWRRSPQWEPIYRALPASGRVYSHRYEQEVPVARIGGQWGDKVSNLE